MIKFVFLSVSEWFIVSDLEIASPSFASLFKILFSGFGIWIGHSTRSCFLPPGKIDYKNFPSLSHLRFRNRTESRLWIRLLRILCDIGDFHWLSIEPNWVNISTLLFLKSNILSSIKVVCKPEEVEKQLVEHNLLLLVLLLLLFLLLLLLNPTTPLSTSWSLSGAHAFKA